MSVTQFVQHLEMVVLVIFQAQFKSHPHNLLLYPQIPDHQITTKLCTNQDSTILWLVQNSEAFIKLQFVWEPDMFDVLFNFLCGKQIVKCFASC